MLTKPGFTDLTLISLFLLHELTPSPSLLRKEGCNILNINKFNLFTK